MYTKPVSASSYAPVSQSTNLSKTEAADSSISSIEKLMEELKNNYKNIHFDFIDFKNGEQIKNYASSQQGMNNVVISQELLKKMASDEKLQAKVKSILDSLSTYQVDSLLESYFTDRNLLGMGLIIDENGEVSKWMQTEEIPDKSIQFPEFSSDPTSFLSSATESKKKYSIPYHYSHSQRMMRLANAKNVTSVRGLIASSYSEIGKVKFQVSDPKEAAAIIRKLKAVIRSGDIKIARLHKEERLFQAERLAAKRQKIMLERQLAEQLRKRKIARKAQERCQTASFDDIFGKPSINDERYRQISERYAASAAAIEGLPSQTLAPTSAISSTPSVEVSVASVTTVDCSA